MRSALARLEALEHKTRDAPASPTARRVKFARRVYGGQPAALARLLAAPDDPARIAEFRLDQFLLGMPMGEQFQFAIAALMAVTFRQPGGDSIRLRPLRIHPSPNYEPFAVERTRGGLVIPCRDERYDHLGRPRAEIFPGSVWNPPGDLGEPALVHGERHPATWEEAAWLAGQADGLYLADRDGDARAFRSAGGRVSARGFGETWKPAGTVARRGDATRRNKEIHT